MIKCLAVKEDSAGRPFIVIEWSAAELGVSRSLYACDLAHDITLNQAKQFARSLNQHFKSLDMVESQD